MSERVREEMVEALAMMLYTADRPSQLGDLAALVGVRFTIADQYQSARRIAAALAARPASAEPVAWMIRHRAEKNWQPIVIVGAMDPREVHDMGERFEYVPLVYATTPPAAQDTARLDWLEGNGLVLSCQDSEQQDGSEVTFWMVGPDLDGSNGHGFGKTARAAIDAAMNAAHAAGATDGK